MTKAKGTGLLPTQADVAAYEMLRPMLKNIANEVSQLSKKKQDGVLNKLKVEMINRVLAQIKDFLKNESSVQFLDLLDTDTLPTNSDTILIISQYDAALSAFCEKYYESEGLGLGYRWFTQEHPGTKKEH
ncbi:MAG: hypothetical protein WCO26_08440 [Deltaproteobacteria bacterium]